jgi:hypothetical protein
MDELTTAEKIEQLFTWESLGTLQGAVAATLIVTNVLGSVIGASFDKWRKWVAFLFAISLELGLAWAAAGEDSFQKWFIALLNGFLVYASAVGINQGAATVVERLTCQQIEGQFSRLSRRFFRAWF